jgi:hypothetical protein
MQVIRPLFFFQSSGADDACASREWLNSTLESSPLGRIAGNSEASHSEAISLQGRNAYNNRRAHSVHFQVAVL